MARIVLGTYLFRYPLGGLNRWTLGWLRGLTDLGHDVFVVERATGGGACYDPVRKRMTDDCRYGISIVGDLLERSGLGGRWCFVDAEGTYHGMGKRALDRLFHSADLFVGMLWKEWLAEASASGLRVFVDGEPGYFQMELAAEREDEADSHGYDHYFTTGLNVGTDAYTGPTAGIDWRPLLLSPVSVSRFALAESPRDAPFTTVMNWRSHRAIQFEGKTVLLYDTFDVPEKGELDLSFLTADSEWRQGVRIGDLSISTDLQLEVVGQTSSGIQIWQDTSPETVQISFSAPQRKLTVYNLWDTGNGQPSSQVQGAGMQFELSGTTRIYHCNDGHPDATFSHLTFSIAITESGS